MKPALLSLFLALLSTPVLAQGTGDVFVSVVGGGSGRIHLDGLDTGNEAPATLRDVEEGEHQVQVFGDCVSGTQTVDVVSGRVTRTELRLQPGNGFMELSVTPEVAEILVDGTPFGTGPQLATEIACGVHILQFEAIGFLTETRPIDVQLGSVHRLQIDLQAEGGKGTFSALVEPVYSEIYIDEVLVATGPITLDDIDAGTHQLVVLADDHARHSQEITIVTGQVTKLDIRLEPTTAPAEPTPPKGDPPATPAPVTPEPVQPQALPTETPSAPVNTTMRRLSAAGLGLAGGAMALQSWSWWQAALDHYDNYQTLAENENPEAETYYTDNVVPAYAKSIGFAIGGGVAVISGLSLGLNNPAQPTLVFSGTW